MVGDRCRPARAGSHAPNARPRPAHGPPAPALPRHGGAGRRRHQPRRRRPHGLVRQPAGPRPGRRHRLGLRAALLHEGHRAGLRPAPGVQRHPAGGDGGELALRDGPGVGRRPLAAAPRPRLRRHRGAHLLQRPDPARGRHVHARDRPSERRDGVRDVQARAGRRALRGGRLRHARRRPADRRRAPGPPGGAEGPGGRRRRAAVRPRRRCSSAPACC